MKNFGAFLNKKACRDYLLQRSVERRMGKFTRVSPDVYEVIGLKVRRLLDEVVDTHPSLGKTLGV